MNQPHQKNQEMNPALETPEEFFREIEIQFLIHELKDPIAIIETGLRTLLEKKEKFGYFINLSPGITALMPKSNFRQSAKPAVIEKLREGDPIPVIIEDIKLQERKITLAPADAEDEQNWKKYTKDNQPAMGSLGEKLQQALESKKKP